MRQVLHKFEFVSFKNLGGGEAAHFRCLPAFSFWSVTKLQKKHFDATRKTYSFIELRASNRTKLKMLHSFLCPKEAILHNFRIDVLDYSPADKVHTCPQKSIVENQLVLLFHYYLFHLS
jgi:hypothetical protein